MSGEPSGMWKGIDSRQRRQSGCTPVFSAQQAGRTVTGSTHAKAAPIQARLVNGTAGKVIVSQGARTAFFDGLTRRGGLRMSEGGAVTPLYLQGTVPGFGEATAGACP